MLEVKDAMIEAGGRLLVRRLSFVARDGEMTCVTGAPATGKTTLLRTVMGFLPVRKGFVSVDGELLTTHSSHAFRQLMVYLPQDIHLLAHSLYQPEAPVCEPVEQAVWNGLLPTAVQETRPNPLSAEEILLLAQQTIRQAKDRPIIIADEPAAHLSDNQATDMLELLQKEARQGKTVLVASRRSLFLAQASKVINLDELKP